MDNKTLIEIILKKIAEIEAIAQNFTKPEPIYQIDIDLALSKVRSLYNELLMLNKIQPEPYQIVSRVGEEVAVEEKISPYNVSSVPEPDPIQEEEAYEEDIIRDGIDDIGAESEVNLENRVDKHEENFSKDEDEELIMSTESEVVEEDFEDAFEFVYEEEEKEKEKENEEEKEKEKEKEANEKAEAESKAKAVEQKAVKSESEPKDLQEKLKGKQPTLFDGSVINHKGEKGQKTIAEKFGESKISVNDLVSGFNKEKDLATQLTYKPIKDIKSAISLNDKIMFIKELFNENAEKCNAEIDHLNRMESFDLALEYINQNFDWSDKGESAKKFLELVYRRFLENGK